MPCYTSIKNDQLKALVDWPSMSFGAPMPIVYADNLGLSLFYKAFEATAQGQHSYVQISFQNAHAHYFSAPNDEALSGHPLHGRGLDHYSTYEVLKSSWIEHLEVGNRVHSNHKPSQFSELRHFIATFHDELFECVAPGYRIHPALPGAPKLLDSLNGN